MQLCSVSRTSRKKSRYFTLLLNDAHAQRFMRINTYYILFYCNFYLKGLDIFEVFRDRAIKHIQDKKEGQSVADLHPNSFSRKICLTVWRGSHRWQVWTT